ncbi:GntR family transcriptional regulator [Pseudomonas sp. SCB32]|uniref:GntR family transcriptional regulator n=1 Tax=Pseudomonas sp. SCB32 TaxID=2653853 RepID=UPI001263F521|nr:GntR family transcriptional regulator [Pseudomonas sp. SCB32]
MQYSFAEVGHTSLGSSVYQMLQETLMSGQLKPGDRLRIRELSAQLGTSITPVREALLQLVNEQALVMQSARDMRVPVLSAAQFEETQSIRIGLESIAARAAAKLATEEQIEGLRQNIEANLAAIARDDMIETLRLNRSFHFMLADIAEMPLLRSFLSSLWMRTGPLIAVLYERSKPMTIDHHGGVVEALAARNPVAAMHAVTQDILDGQEIVLEFLRSRM